MHGREVHVRVDRAREHEPPAGVDLAPLLAADVADLEADGLGKQPARQLLGNGARAARGHLARRDRSDGVPAGPYERRPLAEKRGVVIHYSGPPVERRGRESDD